jgi:hypothetical protein
LKRGQVVAFRPSFALHRFPTPIFTYPRSCRKNLIHCGLEVEGIFGVEGPGGWLHELDWDDASVREQVLGLARDTESDSHLLSKAPIFSAWLASRRDQNATADEHRPNLRFGAQASFANAGAGESGFVVLF